MQHAHTSWRARAEALRKPVDLDPEEQAFLCAVARQLGSATDCPKCIQRLLQQAIGDREVYQFGADGVRRFWDIERAQAIVRRDRVPATVLLPSVAWSLVIGHDATIDHVDHLPPATLDAPVILAAVVPDICGRTHILIDGTHRVLRALRDKRPIRAVVLDACQSHAAQVSEREILEAGQPLIAELTRLVRLG